MSYYTPEIEEFHVGFEYEAKSYISDNWIKTTWNIKSKYDEQFTRDMRNGMHEPFIYIEEDKIRVKHLDREDIESLGFDNYIPPREYDHTWHYKGSKEPKIKVWFNNPIPVVRIYSSYPAQDFQGIVKNKSELKRLLKQLGI